MSGDDYDINDCGGHDLTEEYMAMDDRHWTQQPKQPLPTSGHPIPSWPRYFFDMIKVIRQRSKDKHTQVGCVIVGPANEIRSTGYNSFPRGINDHVEERFERPEKYLWLEHSERNAIYNAARVGVPLEGTTIYMMGIPCIDCARGIIQAGIKRIIYDKEEWAKWKSPKYDAEMAEKAITMLTEAKVEIIAV